MLTARQYREVVVRAISAAGPKVRLLAQEVEADNRLVIVLTSEQPLSGGFNHLVIDRALVLHKERAAHAKVELIVVGQRGGRVMTARGLTPLRIERGPTSLAGLKEAVKGLANYIDHEYTSGKVAAVDLVYTRYQSISECVPTVMRLLPFDPAILPAVPPEMQFQTYLSDSQLIAGLVSQYAYISLFQAAAESYACEQASRLIAMNGATRNTSRIVDDLLNSERRERQHEITGQMLEMIASRVNLVEE